MSNINFAEFPLLKTERLILRQLAEDDVQEIFYLRSDAAINKYLERQQAKTLKDALVFINNIIKKTKNKESFYWGIALQNNNKLIGTICLFEFSDNLLKCEIGYELLTTYQKKGIMTEAIKKIIDFATGTIGIKKIEAFTHKDNLDSIKLLKNLNFMKANAIDAQNDEFITFTLDVNIDKFIKT